jgi:hypothetical protein
MDTNLGYMGADLGGVTWGNGIFVGVGKYISDDAAYIETSIDGLAWQRIPKTYSVLDLYAVTYGKGIFVAVGWDSYAGRNAYTSTNGINWSPGQLTGLPVLTCVTFGNNLFVAGATASTYRNLCTSPDGINWTARDSGAPASDPGNIQGVAFGNGTFVAVDSARHCYVSPTGGSWTQYTNRLVGSRIDFCNDFFFTPTGPGTNSISTDGTNWVALTNNTGVAFKRVVYAAGMYVAISDTGVFTSTDMTNWVVRPVPGNEDRHLNAVCFGGGRFLTVGYASPLPYVPLGYVSDPVAGIRISNGTPPVLQLSGLLQHFYRIDRRSPGLGDGWESVGNILLTNSPQSWSDSGTNGAAFYRSVLLP